MNTVTIENIIIMIRGLINDNLKTNGRDSFIYDQDVSFSLGKDYVSSTTIQVYQNGILLTPVTDWSYNSATNKVTITASLIKNDDILILYSYYDKYSDSEMISYISANLSKFVTHRYPKTFYVNTDNEIVTLDGFNPTVDEANVIAIITAVSIDPNNVNIKTRDFSITSEEKLSKSEQIDNIFSKWTRTFGTPDFLENE